MEPIDPTPSDRSHERLDPRWVLEIPSDLPRLPHRLEISTHGSSRMSMPQELDDLAGRTAAAGDYSIPDVALAGVDGNGQTRVVPDVRLPLGPAGGSAQVLAIGQTGAGKSFLFMLRMALAALRAGRSVIGLVSKIEEARILMACALALGIRIRQFNVFDARRSFAWNPAAKVKSRAQAHDLAHFALSAGRDASVVSHDSPFFFQTAVSWVANYLFLKSREGPVTLPDVAAIFGRPLRDVAAAFEAYKDDPAIGAIWSFMTSGSQNADTAHAEVNANLKWLLDESVARVLSAHEGRLDRVGEEQTLLLVMFQEERMDVARPVNNLFFTEMLKDLRVRAAAEPSGRLPIQVTVMADEFATAIGRLNGIETDLHTLRSRGVQVVAAVQSLAQLDLVYGRAAPSVIAGFTDLVFLPKLAHVDAEYASMMSGRTTVSEETTRHDPASSGVDADLVARDQRAVARPLLTPDEVRYPPRHYVLGRPALVFRSDMRPFWAYLKPLYEMPSEAALLAQAYAPDFADPTVRRRAITTRRTRGAKGRAALDGMTVVRADPITDGATDGFTDTRGWPADRIRARLEQVKATLDWPNTTGSAKRWWEAFEGKHLLQLSVVLRLAEELAKREATVTEFFLAVVYSNTDDLQGALHYLAYTRLKKAAEERKRSGTKQ